MNHSKVLATYGLKFNPFLPAIPTHAIWVPPAADLFFFRVETLILDGGFAVITGDPGLGKSKLLQALAARLARIGDEIAVGVMARPQSGLGDFYRELGDLFEVDLKPSNRYGGFKALRERWKTHLKSTLFRPVLLVDEGQEMLTPCLNELRLLGSVNFDSECLLTTVIAGDSRLLERFRLPDLLPLGSRIRTRLPLQPLSPEQMLDFLEHLLDAAGAPHLITENLKHTLAQQSAGNPRILSLTAAELLQRAAESERNTIDENLYLELCSPSTNRRATKRSKR